MYKSLIVVDDFAPDAAEVRAAMIAGGVGAIAGPHGEPYKNVSRMQVPAWHAGIERIMGFPLDVTMSGFRFDLAGEYPHCHVHADTATRAKWAAIVYLNLPADCRGGTGFFTHTRKHIDRMPTAAQIEAHGEDPAAWTAELEREWSIPELWTMTGLVGMKFNRLAIYPTVQFHARYPREGFGTSLEDGRCVWVCFFNRKPKEPAAAPN